MVAAVGYKRHISQIFDVNDPYFDSDAVFGVRTPLTVPYDQRQRRCAAWQRPDRNLAERAKRSLRHAGPRSIRA